MTVSEKLFVEYCERRGYVVEAIERQPNVRKTADFKVTAHGCSVIVEVKELVAGPENLRASGGGENGGEPAREEIPGSRAWQSILQAGKQLHAHRSEGVPLVIVMYDNIEVGGKRHAHPYADLGPAQLDAAMYGSPKPHAGDGSLHPSKKKIHAGGLFVGGEMQYVSAVCVLYDIGGLRMQTYHNVHASHPLPLGVFAGEGDGHLRKGLKG